jgi:hypothetical protein
MSAYVSICQHMSAYVSIRQHTSAYVHLSSASSVPNRLLTGDCLRTAVRAGLGRRPLKGTAARRERGGRREGGGGRGGCERRVLVLVSAFLRTNERDVVK